MHRQDRTAASGKTRGGGLCLFVNNSRCANSNIKEVSRFCLPEVQYLLISCRVHYLPRECSSIFFVAVYFPPQTNAGTKTALNELYKAISKQENAHPVAVPLVAKDFNTEKLKLFYLLHVQEERKKTLDYLYSKHKNAYKALPRPPFGKSDHNFPS